MCVKNLAILKPKKPEVRMATKFSQSNGGQVVSQDAIAQRAYEIWEREGRPEGRAAEHWFRAVSELKAQNSSTTHEFPANKAAVRRSALRAAEKRFQTAG